MKSWQWKALAAILGAADGMLGGLLPSGLEPQADAWIDKQEVKAEADTNLDRKAAMLAVWRIVRKLLGVPDLPDGA